MRLNRYILALSLCILSAVPVMLACGWGPDYTGYQCSPFNLTDGSRGNNGNDRPGFEETLDFWSGYVDGKVSRTDIRNFFNTASIDSIGVRSYRFYDYLAGKSDRNALDYIRHCLELSALVDTYQADLWDYEPPSPETIRQFISRIENVSTSNEFKPRYEFLKIRAYGAIKDNDGVMKVWKKNEKKKMPEALRIRMSGYVGGVLYRQGNYPEALDYFYRAGDKNSIQWCVEKLAGSDNLLKLYNHNPSSPAIPFILEDYMNYLISTTDAGRNLSRKSDYYYDDDYSYDYDAYAQRIEMMSLCRRALDECKTDCPLAWASALGVLQGVSGETSAALSTLTGSKGLAGTPVMVKNLDNFILWALMLNSGKGNADNDSKFAAAFAAAYSDVSDAAARKMRDFSPKGLERQLTFDANPDASYRFLTEFMAEEAVTYFESLHQPQRAMAFLAMLDDLPALNYGDKFLRRLRDKFDRERPLEDGKTFLAYVRTAPAGDIDKLMQPYACKYANLANDALGTRLMRMARFKDALAYLAEVDPKWARTQPIAPYLKICYVNPEYYSFGRDGYINLDVLRSNLNYKAIYCAEMIGALEDYDKLSGDAKAMKALEIAGRCHFATPLGSGWAVAEYSWSSTEPENEFTDMTRQWLDRATQYAGTPKTRMLAGYALLTLPSGKSEYETKFPFGIAYRYNPDRWNYYIDAPTEKQKQALSYISSHWNEDDMPWHISHCDVLQAYVAGHFVAKPRY